MSTPKNTFKDNVTVNIKLCPNFWYVRPFYEKTQNIYFNLLQNRRQTGKKQDDINIKIFFCRRRNAIDLWILT